MKPNHLKGHLSKRIVEMHRLSRRQDNGRSELDFGWSPFIMNAFWVTATLFLAVTGVICLKMPKAWPIYTISSLLALNCFIGNGLVRKAKNKYWVTLPLVGLFGSSNDLVLDAGCGGGRTTISIAKALRNGRIVALDRFDSNYIEGGGRDLLSRNLKIAGIEDRVQVQDGEITDLPFGEGHFNSAVSVHTIDHLGARKQKGIEELFRVLKPGGRFLMVVGVPGWMMFGIANILSFFFLTSKPSWRAIARKAGFDIADEGLINGVWFVLLEKPAFGV